MPALGPMIAQAALDAARNQVSAILAAPRRAAQAGLLAAGSIGAHAPDPTGRPPARPCDAAVPPLALHAPNSAAPAPAGAAIFPGGR